MENPSRKGKGRAVNSLSYNCTTDGRSIVRLFPADSYSRIY